MWMRSCSGRWNWKENTAGNQRGSNSVGHARLHDDDDGDDDMMMMMTPPWCLIAVRLAESRLGKHQFAKFHNGKKVKQKN